MDIKDKDGNLKSHEEKPIRSMCWGITGKQGSSIHSYFPNKVNDETIESNIYKSYRIFNNINIGAYNTLGFGDAYGHFCGIHFVNISGSLPFKNTWAYNGASTTNKNITNVSLNPTFNPNTNTIDFSIYRQCTMSSSGSLNSATQGIALGMYLVNDSSQSIKAVAVLDTFNETKTWNLGDVVKITYNFNFPTSTSSTLTRNLINDLFASIITSGTFKNKNGDIVAIKRSTVTDPGKGLPSIDYVKGQTNNTNRGIVLGSSNSDVSWEDYCLNSEFDTTELQPQASSGADYWWGRNSGNTLYCMYARNFKNISDHDITIREAGVFSYATDTTYTVAQVGSFLLAHWLTGDVVVHSGETIRVYWKPTVIVS